MFTIESRMPPPPDPPDIRARLQQSLGEAYILERELGGGGMSRVFVADDTGLGRKVVVKVLAPELAEGLSLERFEREIRMVASLQQANIVPLLAAGRTGELPYYTMPLVEGRSLRDRLAKEGALPLRDAVNILRDVARALAFAHERGVVHRDIKPENILLSGDTAVVTDFGIAKALSVARGDDAVGLTGTGLGIGTPLYMAPEQAVGDPDVDHRADLYAFGCVAFEVLTGRPPFPGLRSHQVVAAHIQATPQRVVELRADVPLAISSLIARCLEKDPAERPQTARELLGVLDKGSGPADGPRPRTPYRTPLAAGFVFALLAALAVVEFRRQDKSGNPAAQAASLAVLPFLNVGGDSAQEYLADGIRDELATAMGHVPGVRIIGRSAAFRYRGQRDIDVRQAGHALGARYLLQGTLRQANGRLHVSAQLSDSAAGAELWAGDFDRNPNDLVHVRDDIVRAISDTLRARLGTTASAPPRRAPAAETSSPDAYDEYLRGEFLLQRRGPGVARSIAMFEHASALDEHFARAHAGLSAALVLLPYFTGTFPKDGFQRAIASADRAIALDSSLSEPHTALGIAFWHVAKLTRAEQEFQSAVRLEPDDAQARLQYGRFLLETGRVPESLVQFEQAKRNDAVSALFSAWHSYALFLLGRDAEALRESQRGFQIDSALLPGANLAALMNIALGRMDEARRIMERQPAGGMSNAAFVFAAAGDTAAAWRFLHAMDLQIPTPWFTDVARGTALLAVGDTANALAALERSAARSGILWTEFIPVVDPSYNGVRGSSRFAILLRANGLDERQLYRARTAARR
jgi:TolB-like protein/tRNA A-37 threonylcarbamoyl transferase component Bud32/Tfp pilus assembly protein PilF